MDVFERAPPPDTVQVTPAAFLSFVTTAVRVIASVASTVVPEAVTVTLVDWMLPHPERYIPATSKRQTRAKLFRTM